MIHFLKPAKFFGFSILRHFQMHKSIYLICDFPPIKRMEKSRLVRFKRHGKKAQEGQSNNQKQCHRVLISTKLLPTGSAHQKLKATECLNRKIKMQLVKWNAMAREVPTKKERQKARIFTRTGKN